MRQLQGADDKADGSYWHQPSIAEHPQNQKFRDWTALIDLARDSWIATAGRNPDMARAEVERWLSIPYPLFRRLAFFAATETELFSPSTSMHWLLADQSWWLWSVETEREALRLLGKLAKELPDVEFGWLQTAILQGPPAEMFEAATDVDQRARFVDHEIWLRLAKSAALGHRALNYEAGSVLGDISQRFPDWQLAPDESDEFPYWMGDIGDWFKKQNTPKELLDLEKYLQIPVSETHPSNDDWFDRTRDDFPTAAAALVGLAQKGAWPAQRWRTALQVWSDAALLAQSWDRLKDIIASAPEDFIASIAQPLSFWLQALAKVISEDADLFFELVNRVLATQVSGPYDVTGDDPLLKAINHPVGQATEAVFRWWYRQNLKDNQGLLGKPRTIYSNLCNQAVLRVRTQ